MTWSASSAPAQAATLPKTPSAVSSTARTGRYDAAATLSTATETLFDIYRTRIASGPAPERGDHAVF